MAAVRRSASTDSAVSFVNAETLHYHPSIPSSSSRDCSVAQQALQYPLLRHRPLQHSILSIWKLRPDSHPKDIIYKTVVMSRPRRPTMPSLGSNGDSYRSSIRLRRMPSEASFAREEPSAGTTSTDETVTRRRSLSAPQRPRVQSISRPEVGRQPTHMTPIEEGQTPVRLQPPEDAYMRPDSTIIRDYAPVVDTNKPLPVPPSTRSRRTSLRRSRPTSSATDAQEYDSNLVDLLDLVGKLTIHMIDVC